MALEECLCREVETANQWYIKNGMIVNENKHQALVLGDTEYTFSFPVKDSIDVFGMNIDNKLLFDRHISSVCKKINSQLNVMLRFRKLISSATLVKLYKAFILPHFHYCSSVWHFCGARNTDKIKALYVCMYVCMYVSTYVRTYVCMYVCMYACMHACTCMYVCMYVCMLS